MSLRAWASDVLVVPGQLVVIGTRLLLGDLTFGSRLVAELIMCSLHLSFFYLPKASLTQGIWVWSVVRRGIRTRHLSLPEDLGTRSTKKLGLAKKA